MSVSSSSIVVPGDAIANFETIGTIHFPFGVSYRFEHSQPLPLRPLSA